MTRCKDFTRNILTGLRKGTIERSVSPKDPLFQETIAGMMDLAYDQYGIRSGLTIFGATYDAKTVAEREKAVDLVCEVVRDRPQKAFYIEIANEGDDNGFAGDSGRDELKALVARVADRLPTLVAPTCNARKDDITKEMIEYYYRGSKARVITEHHSRSTSPPDGVWRPTKKVWRETMFLVAGCPALRINQEPRGPESSGSETNDPLVLAMDAVVTWVSGEGAYVSHCGGGIYGLADPARNRPARLKDTQNYVEIHAAIAAMRDALPADLPNWDKHRTKEGPFTFVDTPQEQFAAGYSATLGSGVGQRIVQPVWGVVQKTEFTLKAGRCEGMVLNPLDKGATVAFDRSFTVTPQQRAVVVVATRTA